MAPNSNGSSPDYLFEISSIPPLSLKAGQCVQVELSIDSKGSSVPPSLSARLEVAPPRTWLQSLLARLGKRDSFPSASLDWLELVGKHLLADLSTSDPKIPLSVIVDVPRDVQPGNYQFRLALVGPGDRPLAHSSWITIGVKSDPFTIQALQPGPQPATLLWKRQKDWKFQVTNTSGAPLQGRVRLTPHEAQAQRGLFSLPGFSPQVSWLKLEGQAEQDYGFPDRTGYEYTAHLDADRQAPAGLYAFSLDAADADNPDERFSRGPLVTFRIPAFPWALAATLLIVLLLAAGIWALRRPQIQLAPLTVAYIDFQAGSSEVITPTVITTAASQPFTITAGTQFTYTLSITNTTGLFGRRAADWKAVGEVVNTFLGGAAFTSGSGVCDTKNSGSSIACYLPADISIQSGQSYTLTVSAKIDPAVHSGQIVTHTLQLGNHPPDAYPIHVIRQSGLNLIWDSTPDETVTYRQDQTITETLRVANAGSSQSDQVVFSFQAVPLSGQNSSAIHSSSFMTLTAVTGQPGTCVADRALSSVKCQWDTISPDEVREVTLTIVPGPDMTGIFTQTVILADSVSSAPYTRPLLIGADHGLAAQINAQGDGVEVKTGEPLLYSVVVSNQMPFTAREVQVNFRPDPRLGSLTLEDIEPKDCSIYIRTPSNPAAGSAEYGVLCEFPELATGETQTMTVKTVPPEPGTYDSSAEVDSRGFTAVAKASTQVAIGKEYALRLDGSTPISVTLSGVESVASLITGTFQAKTRFYYAGSGEGNILRIEAGGDSSPGLSLRVQPGILTLNLRGEEKEITQQCFLSTPTDGSGEWFTVELSATETTTLTSWVTTGNVEKVACPDPQVKDWSAANQSGPVVLTIGGAEASSGKNYAGAVALVHLTSPEGEWNWEFGSESNKNQKVILDESKVPEKAINLPADRWAWVPAQSTVLMPLQIISDSTWKAHYTTAGSWRAPDFNDQDWPYAWDMPNPGGWFRPAPPLPEARWIWAVQPYQFAWSKSCGFFESCSWRYPDFPLASDVYIRKVIELPGNPVTATVQIAGDDFYTFFANQIVEGSCLTGQCYSGLHPIFSTQLHAGPNTIAIQAHNSAGPAGILVIIEIDFYPVLIIP